MNWSISLPFHLIVYLLSAVLPSADASLVSTQYRFPRSFMPPADAAARSRTSSKSCRGNHRNFFPERKGFYVFAITQDCQALFARPDQLEQLATAVQVRSRLTYCLPTFLQLHWRDIHGNGRIGLQLLLKRANNQICTLPVEFPTKNALSGYTIFTYSLLSSLNYASCSYMPNSTFSMEPELSFMDSTYSDIIYFVDPKSSGSFWTIRQFKIDRHGYFKALETFIVKNFAEERAGQPKLTASEFLLTLDNQRNKLYAVHKRNRTAAATCAFDLLFRPHKAKVSRHSLMSDAHSRYRINAFASDRQYFMFGEVHRLAEDEFASRIYLSDKMDNASATCIVQVPYLATFGFVTEESLEALNEIALPHFSRQRTSKIHLRAKPHMKPKVLPSDEVPPTGHSPTTANGMATGSLTKTTTSRRLPTTSSARSDVGSKPSVDTPDGSEDALGLMTELATDEGSRKYAEGEASGEETSEPRQADDNNVKQGSPEAASQSVRNCVSLPIAASVLVLCALRIASV